MTVAGWLLLAGASAPAQTTVRASVASSGAQAGASSGERPPMLSADGSRIVFCTSASNLVAGDSNGVDDVFIRDLVARTTRRVSVDSAGAEGNGWSSAPAISRGGRFVSFASYATNLVPGDTNGKSDVFLRDTLAGTTERLSISSSGAQANAASLPSWGSVVAISDDGRFAAFESNASNLVANDVNNVQDVFVRDRLAGTTERASSASDGSPANGTSYVPTLSADGRFVAYSSEASNLVAGDTNGEIDVFVRDRWLGTTARVNLTPAGLQSTGWGDYPAISASGEFVAFLSPASDLLPGNTNPSGDLFLRALASGLTERVNVDSSGSPATLGVADFALSSDARFVAFSSEAPDLVAGDTNARSDVFLRDRASGTTSRVSVSSAGAQADGESYSATVNQDGSVIGFVSDAPGLVIGDTNAQFDVFARIRVGCAPIGRYCSAKTNSLGCEPRITAQGVPSASASSGFVIGAERALAGQFGVLFFGVGGPNDRPFQGGTLCVLAPLRRTQPQLAAGGGAPPCAGTYALDWNAWLAANPGAPLSAGTQIWCQYWMRDGAAAACTTDALTFVLCD